MKSVALITWYILTLTGVGYILGVPSKTSGIKDYPEYEVKDIQDELKEVIG